MTTVTIPPCYSPLQPPSLATTTKVRTKQQWQGLYGSATALAIANVFNHESKAVILVVTPDTACANRLYDELQFFCQQQPTPVPILPFIDWETLPYDNFSPHDDIISTRLKTLYRLQNLAQGIIIVAMNTLMAKLPPVDYVQQHSFLIDKGDTIAPQALTEQLSRIGYRCVETVYAHGEFALRGSLVDLFPMGSEQPLRIDFFDDTVDSLRTFDAETQRTVTQVDNICLLPAKEFPLDKSAIRLFRTQWHDTFHHDPKQCPIYQDVSQGIAPAGIEYYLPLFFTQTASLFDYLPKHTQVISVGQLASNGEQYWQEAQRRFDSRQGDILRPVLPPDQLFFTVPDIFSSMKNYDQARINTSEKAHICFTSQPLPELSLNADNKPPFTALKQFLNTQPHRVLLIVESRGRREILLDLLKQADIKPALVDNWSDFLSNNMPLAICESMLEQGFILKTPALAVITESQLLGQQVKQRRRRRSSDENPDNVIKHLTELHQDAPVVHIDHGVGRYKGLQTLATGDGQERQENEFLILEYADNARLYVPVTQLQVISRYSGANEDLAPLHRLGNDQWKKAKDKAAKEVRDIAAELLEVYARRDAKKGFAFPYDKPDYERFSATFPFEETADQSCAIHAVRNDMLSDKPMDRLVCGDVGFGKTEVAMRAAFLAANAGKQVAILVPTTLLAQQHYENFVDRFANWPIHIGILSRFNSRKAVEKTTKEISSGQLDIIIGTHKILSENIHFAALGLLIIDEEHRFGVKQKEAIKALRSEVDILTLTATPIPRTLNMAMHGIRDLSIIATPPAKRLSVKTFVQQKDPHLLKEAILRETLRGGQVYYLHNEVKSIEKATSELQALLPDIRIGIAHGQLREKALEHVMSEFYHQRYHVLVCTTIIETGIDIPNANTIIIERADTFGLAQLHQLRGRVGRSHHQAYAYLLVPPEKNMTPVAIKRLEAIANANDLGAGFTLATHDLEIRGAGELLGDEQSGQMQSIGFSLYMEMLDETIKAMREGKDISLQAPVKQTTEVNLHIAALLPDDYISDTYTRLRFYKRLSMIDNASQLDELQVELIDRFGLLPEAAKHLIRSTQLRLDAQCIGVEKIEANAKSLSISIRDNTVINPLRLIELIQTAPQTYQLRGANGLVYHKPMHTADERFSAAETLLTHLKNP